MRHENQARPTKENRIGKEVESERGPRGNVDREDDERRMETPAPLPGATRAVKDGGKQDHVR
jgi:hypothetical protein